MAGINLKSKNFLESMRLFEDEKKIEPEFIIETLKSAIVKAYQKHIDAPEAQVRVDVSGKELKIYHQLIVVEDNSPMFDETLDIYFSDAKAINPKIQLGEIIEHEVDFNEISRNSINVAKQMLKQNIKEYEKQRVYEEYKDKEFELISGIIKTVEEKFVLVDIKNTIGILLKGEQIPGEVYKEGQTIKCIIKEVSSNSKGSQVVLSRADATFVKRLFEKEVPEIQQGIVEIRTIAREAGERCKMAVYSKNEEVDAIGACIGPRGSRVQSVITEVKGEKIDVFEWNDDIGELVKNALAPAEVVACFYSNQIINPSLTDEELEKLEKRNAKPLVVVVNDDQLSVAIGKGGKNAKLAVKLTNRKIDIKTQSDIDALDINVDKEVAEFKKDQARIIKEKEQQRFLKLQEEAMKRNAEFKEELQNSDTGFDEETLEEMVEKPEEITIVDIQNQEVEKEEQVNEEVVETKDQEVKAETKQEIKEETKEEEKPKQKKVRTPKTEYVSKFENIASASAPKKEEKPEFKKKKKSKEEDDRRIRAEDLQKKEYSDEFKPVYSDEELEEIEAAEQELEDNSWINDDDIDFDEYDEYYDEGK